MSQDTKNSLRGHQGGASTALNTYPNPTCTGLLSEVRAKVSADRTCSDASDARETTGLAIALAAQIVTSGAIGYGKHAWRRAAWATA